MTTTHATPWLLLLAALSAGCLHVNEPRVDLDTRVGIADGPRYALRVDEGLATVRAHAPGAITLWAQAPTLTAALEVEPEAPRFWDVELRNTMVDAELTVRDADTGAFLRVTPAASSLPTRKRWRVERGDSTRLELIAASPDAGFTEPFRFAVLNDVQEDVDRVQDIFTRLNQEEDVRFLVSNGDITGNGTREEMVRFQQELEELEMPLFSTIGNHELIDGDHASWIELFGRANFSWRFKGARFTFVDTASASLHPRIYTWLDGWLDAGADDLHVFVGHITPLDPQGLRHGAFRSRREGAKLLSRLAEHDVDLTLYGHIHSLYVFSNAGIPAYISGGGGGLPEELDGIDRHVLIVEIDPAAGEVIGVTVVRVPD